MYNNPRRKKNKDNRHPSSTDKKPPLTQISFPSTSANPEFVKMCMLMRNAGSMDPAGSTTLAQIAASHIPKNKSGTAAAAYTNNNGIVLGRSHSLYKPDEIKPKSKAPSKYNVQQINRSPHTCAEPKIIDKSKGRKIKETAAVYQNRKKDNAVMIERCPNCKQYPCLGHTFTDKLNQNFVPKVTESERKRGQPHLRPTLGGNFSNASTSSTRYNPSSNTSRNTYHGVVNQKVGSISAQVDPRDAAIDG